MATLVAVPARAATCPELTTLSPDKPKGQVVATMDGDQVVGRSDPDGTGTLLLTFQSQTSKEADIAFQISTTNVATPFSGGHIHHGVRGETGRSVVELFQFSDQPDQSGVKTVSKCLAHDIFHHPEEYYVDIHNFDYPDTGAVRGQLQAAD